MAKRVVFPYYDTYAEVGTQSDDGRLADGMLYLLLGSDRGQKWVMSPPKAAELIDALVRTLAELPASSDAPPPD